MVKYNWRLDKTSLRYKIEFIVGTIIKILVCIVAGIPIYVLLFYKSIPVSMETPILAFWMLAVFLMIMTAVLDVLIIGPADWGAVYSPPTYNSSPQTYVRTTPRSCPACNGTGRCPLCRGTGRVGAASVYIKESKQRWICSTCNSTGVCRTCQGPGIATNSNLQ